MGLKYNVMKYRLYILVLLAFVPLMLLRDVTPNNELRYLSIADEAIRNGTLFAFTNHGVPYADKPPLYFWLLMAARRCSADIACGSCHCSRSFRHL